MLDISLSHWLTATLRYDTKLRTCLRVLQQQRLCWGSIRHSQDLTQLYTYLRALLPNRLRWGSIQFSAMTNIRSCTLYHGYRCINNDTYACLDISTPVGEDNITGKCEHRRECWRKPSIIDVSGTIRNANLNNVQHLHVPEQCRQEGLVDRKSSVQATDTFHGTKALHECTLEDVQGPPYEFRSTIHLYRAFTH